VWTKTAGVWAQERLRLCICYSDLSREIEIITCFLRVVNCLYIYIVNIGCIFEHYLIYCMHVINVLYLRVNVKGGKRTLPSDTKGFE